MLNVTVQEMRDDPEAARRLARQGTVAVMHEGRAVAFLGVDSSPSIEIAPRDEDDYTDDGVARGATHRALVASVDTRYWGD